MVFDPICGKELVRVRKSLLIEYKQRKYYFCSSTCKASFLSEAERIRLRELAKVGALLSAGKVRWGLA